ncbi:HAD-IIA family hydrolase [Acaryochloris marina]|uniref:HAD-superfamily subfamily IIA hydrolase like protein, putative n=1 Tax=Acaryochloris marina (strain MBIC 11017) TaxID=329726 RepID=A8ZNK4_ACAM1|nr:HAD hydrolase-like protein [Acaryochloris marina]ABW32590.1 HAD-superfamily subfamily IIA hydrolase like protein, putative [Acaryochloris marina MBIC11017]
MRVSGILFDLEGVLLKAKTHEVLIGAVELIDFCRLNQLPFGVISNNTVKRPETLITLLNERELSIEANQLLTPLQFLSSELLNIDTALVIGSPTLKTFIQEHDVEVDDTPNVNAVICGGGYSINNHNIDAAYSAIAHEKSRFLCLHKNRVFKDANGITRPDVGCIVTGLEYSTGRKAKTLGKPSPEYFTKATLDWDLSPEEILLISDDPISDLGGGKAMGFQTAFILTGKYSEEIINDLEQAPDHCWLNLVQAQSEISMMVKD